MSLDAKQLAAVGVSVEHHFAPHLYNKRTLIPPGCALTQHAHNYDHASFVVRGVAVVIAVVDGKRRAQEYRAPACLIIPAGTVHEVQNVGREVLEWYCSHITDETDPEKVDEGLHL